MINRNVSRLNLKRSTGMASLNFLAASWLRKNPGLKGVAKAMSLYGKEMAGKISPVDAFKSLSWLNDTE